MKIAQIGQKGIPTKWGGIERHVEELSKVLAKSGHQILAYSRTWYTGGSTVSPSANIRIVHTPTIYTKHLDAIVHTFTATIHALFQKPDIIHYHGVGPAILSFIPRIFSPRTKVVVTFHCIDRYHQKWGWFARAILALGEWAAVIFPHETIAVSKTIQQYCLNEFGRHVTYIPNGVGEQTKPDLAALKNLGLEPEKFVVMISRLVPHKGAQYLITAWAEARKNNPALFSSYKLAIVGDSTFTDKYVAELKRQADDDGDIIFTGWQTGGTLAALYSEAAVLVHPSESEGSPLTVLEAMARGRAVLGSDIAEHKEIVANPDQLFRSTNCGDLAIKLLALLSNATLRVALGEANERDVARNYTFAAIGRDTEKLYSAHTSKNSNEFVQATVRR